MDSKRHGRLMHSEIDRVKVSVLAQLDPVDHAHGCSIGKAAGTSCCDPRPECWTDSLEGASAAGLFSWPGERFGPSA